MSGIKGYSSQKRIQKERFATVSPIDNNRGALDVLPKAVYPVSETETAEALDISPSKKNSELRVVKLTAHTAREGDVLRFTSGDNDRMEVQVERTETNYIYLGGELLADPSGDTFDILRHITLTINNAGALSVSNGPIQFVQDGVDTEVVEDTVTPANNRPLPVKLTSATGDINITAGDLNVQSEHTGANFDSIRIGDGTETVEINASGEMQVRDDDANTALTSLDGKDFATQTTLEAARVLLASLDGKDFATQTTLSAILADTASLDGKDFATQTTLEALAAEDFATSAKQDDIITELQSLVAKGDTKRVIASSFDSAPTIPTATRLTTITVPASTRGTELEILTKSGDNFTAYNAASGGDVIARFTQAGGRIPVNLVAATVIYLQSDTGADFTATDLTINLIGVTV